MVTPSSEEVSNVQILTEEALIDLTQHKIKLDEAMATLSFENDRDERQIYLGLYFSINN